MKKMPTLFKRVYDENGKMTGVTDKVTEGLEWVLEGKIPVIARAKIDGACCAIINGEFYRRYDANVKKNRIPPEGSIPCQDAPDDITGSWPHWVKCDRDNPNDKWFWAAYDYKSIDCSDGTYEAVGKHFQGNPYGFAIDMLEKHNSTNLVIPELSLKPLDFMTIHNFLMDHEIEGIVFWDDHKNEPICKIKRTDFGFKWS